MAAHAFRIRSVDQAVGNMLNVLALPLIALLHFALSKISAFSVAVPFEVSLLWLPAGLGVAVCMVLGLRGALAVFAGAFAQNLSYDTSVLVAVSTSLGSASQCLLVAWLLGRFCGLGQLASSGRSTAPQAMPYMPFYWSIVLGGMLAPTVGSLVLTLSGTAPSSAFAGLWIGWWVGDLLGIAVLAPLVFHGLSRLQGLSGLGQWDRVCAMAIVPFGVIVIVGGLAHALELQVSLPAYLEPGVMRVIGALVAGCALVGVGVLLLQAHSLLEEVQVRKERFRTVVEGTSDMIQSVREDGSLDFVNAAWMRKLGYSAQEWPQLKLWSVIAPECHTHCQLLIGRLMAGENVGLVEVKFLTKNGSIIVAEGYASIKDVPGVGKRTLTTFRDVTERKQAEAALHQSNLKVKEQKLELSLLNSELERRAQLADGANRAKSEFLSTMSHELRTPLNAVIGYAYLLQESPLNTDQAQQVQQITASSRHLLGMISDALDLSAIEAGELKLVDEEFSLNELLETVRGMMQALAQGKGLNLQIFAPIDTHRYRGDSLRLRQCLLNFASNAIKFTEQGEITITVGMQAGPEGATQLRFEVRDTGIGIEADRQEMVFQPFQQADMSTRRRYGGTGLGLAITRELVHLMGGEVGLSSQPGVGSNFWFTARVMPAKAGSGSAVSDTDQAGVQLQQRHAGARVLVAEDDQISQGLIRVVLKRVGLQVELACDGLQAVEMARASFYDLVLMDMQMPEMDGLETTAAIRALPGWAQIPIIALTANAFAQDRQKCLAAGMSDFASKPVDPPRLYATMLACIEKNRAMQRDDAVTVESVFSQSCDLVSAAGELRDQPGKDWVKLAFDSRRRELSNASGGVSAGA